MSGTNYNMVCLSYDDFSFNFSFEKIWSFWLPEGILKTTTGPHLKLHISELPKNAILIFYKNTARSPVTRDTVSHLCGFLGIEDNHLLEFAKISASIVLRRICVRTTLYYLKSLQCQN